MYTKERHSKTIIVGAGLNAHVYGAHSYLPSWNNFLEHFYLITMNRDIPGSMAMEEKIRDISNFSEWDLWSALAFRRRNFAKLENRKYEHPIFHMRSGNQNDTSYPQFIQPLYDPSMSFDAQWKKLKEDFSKSKR